MDEDNFKEKPYPIAEKWCEFIKEIEKKDIEELTKRIDVIRMGEKEDEIFDL
jgi:hypothetical protein